MKDYIIFIDASADIDRNIAASQDIRFVPMHYTLGKEDRLSTGPEPIDIMKQLYDGQRKGDMTQTSQITPQTYIDTFAPILKEGKEVIYLSLSSGLTKTFDNVCMAKAELDDRFSDVHIYPVDTLSATGGIGLLAEAALKNKENGMSAKENAENLKELASRVCHVFMVEDLMYLKRGGRISAATAVIGTVLNVKPILIIAPDGSLTTLRTKRGVKSAIRDLISTWEATRDKSMGSRIYVVHADAPDRADSIISAARSIDPDVDPALDMLCPVIGAHTGPGMAAIIYFGDR
ncbi:MAG: DegV family protein, partial [Lachnospiraceae bacterium]|nr:DegV family protein [Lachnospiraceae bacterium]